MVWQNVVCGSCLKDHWQCRGFKPYYADSNHNDSWWHLFLVHILSLYCGFLCTVRVLRYITKRYLARVTSLEECREIFNQDCPVSLDSWNGVILVTNTKHYLTKNNVRLLRCPIYALSMWWTSKLGKLLVYVFCTDCWSLVDQYWFLFLSLKF